MSKWFVIVVVVAAAAALQGCGLGDGPQWAVTRGYAPLLNSPRWGDVFGGADGAMLRTDEQGLVREVETVLPPGSVCRIEDDIEKGGRRIYRISTPEYPYAGKYYVDARFVETVRAEPVAVVREMPSREEIAAKLREAIGARYIWGGNVVEGVPEMLEYYPPAGNIDEVTRERWMVKGVDCSGLLYMATGGATPRNTSRLVSYGAGVAIEGLSAEEIVRKLRPLDLIVWKGHVMIVLDEGHVIQSRAAYEDCRDCDGVRVMETGNVLRRLLELRRGVDVFDEPGRKQFDRFVVRRFVSR